ncbi:hypothetical protein Tco_1174710 [Tanacetum coccineum]
MRFLKLRGKVISGAESYIDLWFVYFDLCKGEIVWFDVFEVLYRGFASLLGLKSVCLDGALERPVWLEKWKCEASYSFADNVEISRYNMASKTRANPTSEIGAVVSYNLLSHKGSSKNAYSMADKGLLEETVDEIDVYTGVHKRLLQNKAGSNQPSAQKDVIFDEARAKIRLRLNGCAPSDSQLCVRNGIYDEALNLDAYVSKPSTMHRTGPGKLVKYLYKLQYYASVYNVTVVPSVLIPKKWPNKLQVSFYR